VSAALFLETTSLLIYVSVCVVKLWFITKLCEDVNAVVDEALEFADDHGKIESLDYDLIGTVAKF
jgi:hypothetical protein